MAARGPSVRQSETDDVRILALTPMVPPACLMEDLPSSAAVQKLVAETRAAVRAVIAGDDDRVIVIAGPCTVYDPAATLEYAARLQALAARHEKDLLVIMRVNFRKPSRTRAWEGFVHDPARDGTFQINQGLTLARQLMLRILDMGLAVGTTFHDTLQPQFFADLVTWLWVAPHATRSHVHTKLASGLSMPVAFCDRGGGVDFESAQAEEGAVLRAMRECRMPHVFLSVSKQGVAGIVHTGGNDDGHVIVGGADAVSRAEATKLALDKHNIKINMLVDCSAAPGDDTSRAQADAVAAVAAHVGGGHSGVCGVMLKSNLLSGRQEVLPPPPPRRVTGKPNGPSAGVPASHGTDIPPTVHGMSITDPCVDWSLTAELAAQLAEAARHRRSRSRSSGYNRALQVAARDKGSYTESASTTDNLRIKAIQPLLPPACLIQELPAPAAVETLVSEARETISRILAGQDGRLLVVMGPPVVHDVTAAREFAGRLRLAASLHSEHLFLVMAANFERTHAGAGWRGLVTDPDLDGSFRINHGLRLARRLLLDVAAMGIPTCTDFLDTILPQYLADLTSYSVLDPTAASSHLQAELASGLSMPVAFRMAKGVHASATAKDRALAAAASVAVPHVFLSVSKENLASIVHTAGNNACHLAVASPEAAEDAALDQKTRLIMDCCPPPDDDSAAGDALQAASASVRAAVDHVKRPR